MVVDINTPGKVQVQFLHCEDIFNGKNITAAVVFRSYKTSLGCNVTVLRAEE